MLLAVEQFYNYILTDEEDHRYRSWELCFNAFWNTDLSDDIKSLHLAFYLSSWGMYRGSFGLLWKGYKVHIGAVAIANLYAQLRITNNSQIPKIDEINKCYNELSHWYSSKKFNDGKNGESQYISPTNALISKILLGIFGVTPAFDRYFQLGVNHVLAIKNCNIKKLPALYFFADKNIRQIEQCQSYIASNAGIWYTPMKILDMYFWQVGNNITSKKNL